MPAYNFKKEFAPMVEDGRKRQTIRSARKRQTVKGDILYLYTGMRTKACRKLGQAICKNVMPIIMVSSGVILDGIWLFDPEILRLALDDGFSCDRDFYDFFETHYELPAELELIKW